MLVLRWSPILDDLMEIWNNTGKKAIPSDGGSYPRAGSEQQ